MSRPFDPPYENGRIASPPQCSRTSSMRVAMSSIASSHVDALEAPLSLRAGSHGGILQPRIAVHAVAELPDLGADVAGGRRVQRRAVDLDDPAFADGDSQAARVGAVERDTRCRQRCSPFPCQHTRWLVVGGRSCSKNVLKIALIVVAVALALAPLPRHDRRARVFARPLSGRSAQAHRAEQHAHRSRGSMCSWC